jgi:hypothetical protein
VDPGAAYATVNMTDNGTGGDAIAGDGIYSATIPGHAGNALVAFVVTASDNSVSNIASLFPHEHSSEQSSSARMSRSVW